MATDNIENDLVSTLVSEMTDLINVKGGAVTNLPLSLIRRSQNDLAQMQFWDELIKVQSLTLDGDNASALPTDLDRIFRVASDIQGDGKYTFDYYENGDHSDGYKITNTYTPATGTSKAIQFFSGPNSSPDVLYIPRLAELKTTDYTFFPGDLVLQNALYIYARSGNVLFGLTLGDVRLDRKKLLASYRAEHRYQNRPQRKQVNNVYANEVIVSNMGLGGKNAQPVDSFDRSVDRPTGNCY